MVLVFYFFFFNRSLWMTGWALSQIEMYIMDYLKMLSMVPQG